MSSLHTISRSPSSLLFESCCTLLQDGDGVLFIEDGIYYSTQQDQARPSLPEIKLYCLREDAIARGMLERKSADIETIDYQGFVQLCCEYDKVISWF